MRGVDVSMNYKEKIEGTPHLSTQSAVAVYFVVVFDGLFLQTSGHNGSSCTLCIKMLVVKKCHEILQCIWFKLVLYVEHSVPLSKNSSAKQPTTARFMMKATLSATAASANRYLFASRTYP